MGFNWMFKGLNAELNPICHLLALLGAHHVLHVCRIRVKRELYSFICTLFFILCAFSTIRLHCLSFWTNKNRATLPASLLFFSCIFFCLFSNYSSLSSLSLLSSSHYRKGHSCSSFLSRFENLQIHQTLHHAQLTGMFCPRLTNLHNYSRAKQFSFEHSLRISGLSCATFAAPHTKQQFTETCIVVRLSRVLLVHTCIYLYSKTSSI